MQDESRCFCIGLSAGQQTIMSTGLQPGTSAAATRLTLVHAPLN